MKQYWDTLLKSSFEHPQNIELNLLPLLEHQYKNIHPPTKKIVIRVLHHWFYLLPITFATIWNQQWFKYQNLWLLTMLECPICKPVFSITTCNLICQLNFNIYKSSHWKWNLFLLRKNHIGLLPRISLIRSWIPFLLTI